MRQAGIKPIEFGSRPTTIVGERFYIYPSRQWAKGKLFLEGCRLKPEESVVSGPLSVVKKAWSDDLTLPAGRAVVNPGVGCEIAGRPKRWMDRMPKDDVAE